MEGIPSALRESYERREGAATIKTTSAGTNEPQLRLRNWGRRAFLRSQPKSKRKAAIETVKGVEGSDRVKRIFCISISPSRSQPFLEHASRGSEIPVEAADVFPTQFALPIPAAASSRHGIAKPAGRAHCKTSPRSDRSDCVRRSTHATSSTLQSCGLSLTTPLPPTAPGKMWFA